MKHIKSIQAHAAVHVATFGDVIFRGCVTSFRSGEKRSIVFTKHALINNRPLAVFYDEKDELYEAETDRPTIKFVRAVNASELNQLEGRYGVFR